MTEITSPGKVLFLGGYAVLEGHPALSIAVVDKEGRGVSAMLSESGDYEIVSEQFGIKTKIDFDDLYKTVSGVSDEERLVVFSYATVLAYFKYYKIAPVPLRIDIKNSEIYGGKEDKSGLGSSAGVVTSIIASVFHRNNYEISANREIIMKLSMIAHALARQKTGSGFDIAAAAFGTIKYVRYPPEVISANINNIHNEQEFIEAIAKDASKPWPKIKIEPFLLDGYDLLVFNVKGGNTSTLQAVKAFKSFKKAKPEMFKQIMDKQAEGERNAFKGLETHNFSLVRSGVHSAREAHRMLSSKIREIPGNENADSIEPEALGNVIDASEKIDGVIAGRCPGAGGWDSLSFIIEQCSLDKKNKIVDRINKLAEEEGLGVDLLDCKIDKRGVVARNT